jgi:hypothetical protein
VDTYLLQRVLKTEALRKGINAPVYPHAGSGITYAGVFCLPAEAGEGVLLSPIVLISSILAFNLK